MQSPSQYKCSNCAKLVDPDKTGGLKFNNPVFKHFICPNCQKPTFMVKCVCKSMVLRETPFFFGEKISCLACQRKFNIVPCPVCKQMNLWNGDYYMSAYINCFSCKALTFQHLACPFCQEPNFWITNKSIMSYYKCGLPVNCYVCKHRFQHLMCPHCKEAIYFKNSDYVQGIKQVCPKCTKPFQHVNCPGCGDPSFYKENDFIFGKNYKCGECKTNFCLSICDRCGSLNHLVNKITEVNSSFFDCITCKNKYNMLCCPYCKGPNYPMTQKGNCSNTLCLYCSKVFRANDCSLCSHISVCGCSPGVKHKCAFCKSETANLNTDNNQCISKGTPQTGNGKNPNITLKTSLNGSRMGVNENEEKEKFICKVCFDKPVNTVFLNCGHVCVCFDCAQDLKKKECPMCRLAGDFKKCFF